MPGDRFHYVGREFVMLLDGSYGWVDIKRFWLPARLADPLVGLELLLGHVRYRDHYTSASSQDEDAIDLHGPYRLDQISTKSFDAVDEVTALTAIGEFVGNESDTLTDDVRANLEFRVYRQIRTMPVRYRLRELGEDAFHSFGWVLSGFIELVLMDLPKSEMLLVVAAGD